MTNSPSDDPADVQDPWTLAVDLGCAQLGAVVTAGDGEPQPLEFDGSLTMPGGIWLNSEGHFVIGTAASRQALLAPHRWEPAPVRMLADREHHTLGGADFDPRDAVAEVLGHVYGLAKRRLGRAPARTVLICPEGWPIERQHAMVEAGRRGGLGQVELLGAAHAAGRYLYGARLMTPGAIIGVLDVGAGSVGTAVIQRTDNGLAVLGAAWTDGIGGNSLDLAIFERAVRSVLSLRDPRLETRLLHPADARWRRLRETLMREVRRAREELTRHGIVRVHTDAVADASLELTRHDLDLLIRPQIDQMVAQFKDSLTAAGIAVHRLDGVALFGGAAATPLLARAIVSAVGQLPRLVNEPLTALAFGGVTRAPAPVRLPVPAGRSTVADVPEPAAMPAALAGAGSGAAVAAPATSPMVPPVISPRISAASPAGGIATIPVRTDPEPPVGPPEEPPAALKPPDWPEEPKDEPVSEPEAEDVAEDVAEPEAVVEAEEPPAPLEPPDWSEPPVAVVEPEEPPAPLEPPDWSVEPEAVVEAGEPPAPLEPPDWTEQPEVVAEPEEPPAPLEPPDWTEQPEAVAEPDLAEPATTEPDLTESDKSAVTAPIPIVAALAVPDPASLVPPHVARKLAAQTGSIPVITADDDQPAEHPVPAPDTPDAPDVPDVPESVAATDSQPASRRPRPWVLVAAIAAVVLLAGATAAAIRPSGKGDGTPRLTPALTGAAPSPSPSPSASAVAGDGVASAKWAKWGVDADLAETWSAVVPVAPLLAGSQGQKCKGVTADSPFSNHKIICTYANGIRLTLLQYNTKAKRDQREAQIAAMPGVRQQELEIHNLEGDLINGTFYAQDTGNVWRWWVLDGEVHSAVYTRWPGHNATELQSWWDQNAPFT